MIVRRFPLITVLMALILVCVPSEVQARPRAHTGRNRQHVPRQNVPSARHRQESHGRHTATPAPARRQPRWVKTSPSISFHPIPRHVLDRTPHSTWKRLTTAQPQLAVPAPISLVTDGIAEIGVARPPELDSTDALPTSIPVPVVSGIRKTAESPQLPSIEDAAATPAILPSLYDKRGRLVMPPAMRGSHEILVHQNEMANRDGLARVQDDSDLEWMRRRFMLVALPVSNGIRVDDRLPFNRRYCRPWTAQFLVELARAHYAQFHTTLQVNSAVRTVAFQQRLLHTNGNAAPAEGETASPHLTGQAIDLAKRGLSSAEIAWLRGYLLPLVQQGKIDVEEEFQQACFHISVYRQYQPTLAPPRQEIAVTHRDRPAALAIALQ